MSQGERESGAGREVPGRAIALAVFGGPVAWTLHFMGGYAVVGIGCGAGWAWEAMTWALVIGTVALAGLALWCTATAWRAWRTTSEGTPWDAALSEPGGWYAFLMLTGALLAAVSVIAILLEGFATLMVPLCSLSTQ